MAIHETDYLLGVFPILRGEPKESIDVVQRSTPLYRDFSYNTSVYRWVLVIEPDTITKVLTSKRIGGVVFKSKKGQPPTETFSRGEINGMPKVSEWMGFLQRKFSWTA